MVNLITKTLLILTVLNSFYSGYGKKEELKELTAEEKEKLKFTPLNDKRYEEIIKAALANNKTLEPDQFDKTYINLAKSKDTVRAGHSNTNFRWQYEMSLQIDPKFDKNQKDQITAAIQTLDKAIKCFKFIIVPGNRRMKDTEDHVAIKKDGQGCYSNLGRIGGEQIIVLAKYCWPKLYGAAMHEIMHSLGFFHEHVRPDRDQWIKVDLSKIKGPNKKDMERQYEKHPEQKAYSPEYDFESIMHYPFNQVMQPKKKLDLKYQVGHSTHLSKTDIFRLNKMYPCKTVKGKQVPAQVFKLPKHPGMKVFITTTRIVNGKKVTTTEERDAD